MDVLLFPCFGRCRQDDIRELGKHEIHIIGADRFRQWSRDRGQRGQLPLPLNFGLSENRLLVGRSLFRNAKFGAEKYLLGEI